MKHLIPLLIGALFSVNALSDNSTPKGVIGEAIIDGKSEIYKFTDELPDTSIRASLPWLVVITWRYDGEQTNGMPSMESRERMIQLENAIEREIESKGVARHAYSKTGNHLKELVYYTIDQTVFLAELNIALNNHARYPIEISFFEDKEWSDFNTVLGKFKLHGYYNTQHGH